MTDFCDRLHEEFPLMYREDVSVWVGEGWEPIIVKLSRSIQNYIDSHNARQQWMVDNGHQLNAVLVQQVTVEQVKEKFGGLRFYYDGGDDYIEGLVTMAEVWAQCTCEVCGAKGETRGDLGWITTLCDEHYEERKSKILKDRG